MVFAHRRDFYCKCNLPRLPSVDSLTPAVKQSVERHGLPHSLLVSGIRVGQEPDLKRGIPVQNTLKHDSSPKSDHQPASRACDEGH